MLLLHCSLFYHEVLLMLLLLHTTDGTATTAVVSAGSPVYVWHKVPLQNWANLISRARRKSERGNTGVPMTCMRAAPHEHEKRQES